MVRTLSEVFERLGEGLRENTAIIEMYWEFRGKILAEFLPKEKLEELDLLPPDDWKPEPLTRETVLKKMSDYFEYAVEKCVGQRGISASRSVEHYEEWVWLLGDDEFLREMKETEYEPYGAPILLKVAERYGFDSEHPEAYEKLREFIGLPAKVRKKVEV